MKNEVTMSGVLIKTNDIFEILCLRDSGRIDRVRLSFTDGMDELEGLNTEVVGQIESDKKKPLGIKTNYIYESDEIGLNLVELEGRICKKSDTRHTPDHKEVTTAILAVGDSNYIPCLFWNSNSRALKDIAIGDKISIQGRLQSREFYKTILDTKVLNTTYEVSVMKIV